MFFTPTVMKVPRFDSPIYTVVKTIGNGVLKTEVHLQVDYIEVRSTDLSSFFLPSFMGRKIVFD